MRHPPVTFALAVATLLAVALSGACSDSQPSDGTASAFVGLDGTSLYAQACAGCHGGDLAGTSEGPPFLDAIYRPGHHADASFLLAVRRGVRSHHWNFGDMPPIEGLIDAQVAAISTFVRERQVAAGIE
jgi:mono/diheme cytochrome c family protein